VDPDTLERSAGKLQRVKTCVVDVAHLITSRDDEWQKYLVDHLSDVFGGQVASFQ